MADGKVKITRELLFCAVDAKDGALTTLVRVIGTLLHPHMTRIFLRQGFDGPTARDMAKDACQEILRVFLLEDNGLRARKWDPEKGPFEPYIVLFAKDFIYGKLRKNVEIPLPNVWESAEAMTDRGPTPELVAISKDFGEKIYCRMREELEAFGRDMFELLFVENREVDEVCALRGMTQGTVYQWRSRLSRRMQAIALELEGDE